MPLPFGRSRGALLAGALLVGLALLCLRPGATAAGQEKPPAPDAKLGEKTEEEHGGDIVFQVVGSRLQKFSVLYSHEVHLAAKIECEECHEKTFKKKLNANKFKMADINRGQFCGTCHTATPTPEVKHAAFAPKNNCSKCHTLKLREP